MANEAELIAEVERAEAERCRAATAGDLETVARLLGEDLSYTHSDGRTETKAEVLAGLANASRSVERGALNVSIYGSLAVVSGDILIVFSPPADGSEARRIDGVALEVWDKRDGAWQMIAFQASIKAR